MTDQYGQPINPYHRPVSATFEEEEAQLSAVSTGVEEEYSQWTEEEQEDKAFKENVCSHCNGTGVVAGNQGEVFCHVPSLASDQLCSWFFSQEEDFEVVAPVSLVQIQKAKAETSTK